MMHLSRLEACARHVPKAPTSTLH